MSAVRERVERPLGPVGQIPLGEGREFAVDGMRIAVFRLRAGGLAATAAACPHRGGPLADGITGAGQVVCPLHGRRFSLETGEAEGGAYAVPCFPARVGPDGEILVALPA